MQAHVSVILPVHNAEPWLDECLRSVLQQDFEGTMELSVFNDASKDKSGAIIEKWRVKLEDSGVHVIIGGHDSPSPRGVGYSKNQAVAQSSGSYLCFLDSDDVMMPQRVRLQHQAAVQHPSSIVGCRVRRDPPNSTERYTRWINQLTPEQLLTQVFTANGPTVIMPTWFCSRAWFSHVGPFDEGGQVRAERRESGPSPGLGALSSVCGLRTLATLRSAMPPGLWRFRKPLPRGSSRCPSWFPSWHPPTSQLFC